MTKKNITRRGCKDVFKSFLLENATYDGIYEIPVIKVIHNIKPESLVLFSEKKNKIEDGSWMCFYEDDYKIESLWNNPKKYLNLLSKYEGVVTPDYSVYRDMPLAMQIWNIFRSRAIGCWLQENGLNIIPNIRWGDERTYDIACSGIEKGSTIAVGSHGLIKIKEEKFLFSKGLDYVVNKIKPNSIIIYGCVPNDIFNKYSCEGIKIMGFKSKISQIYKGSDI